MVPACRISRTSCRSCARRISKGTSRSNTRTIGTTRSRTWRSASGLCAAGRRGIRRPASRARSKSEPLRRSCFSWLVGSLTRFSGESKPFQLFPARVEVRERGFGGGEAGFELVGLRGVGAVEIGRGKQRFDARDFGFGFEDAGFHALKFLVFFPGELSRF